MAIYDRTLIRHRGGLHLEQLSDFPFLGTLFGPFKLTFDVRSGLDGQHFVPDFTDDLGGFCQLNFAGADLARNGTVNLDVVRHDLAADRLP